MIASNVSMPTGPMQGHRWSVEPVTHTVRSRGSQHCLCVRTGFVRCFLIFGLSIGLCLFPFSTLFPNGPVAFWVSPLAAFALAVPLVRLYRRIFWQVTFDTSCQIVELRRWGRVEAIPASSVVAFEICHCVDKKSTGFVRWHNEFSQLILVYVDHGDYHRLLITSAMGDECSELVSRLSSLVKVNVKRSHGELGAAPNGGPAEPVGSSGVSSGPPSVS
jgi:hypothetical protein